MNTQSIHCRKVGFAVKPGGIEQPGDFTFDDTFTHIYIWLPGTRGPDALQISRTPNSEPRVWFWNGDTEKPTLTPSIHAPGQWHGYLTNGELKSC